eukprot:SAG11_NODE_15409_length_579_cov_1.081250_1_plen_53_part_01
MMSLEPRSRLVDLPPGPWLAAVVAQTAAQAPSVARGEIGRLAESLRDVVEMQR